MSSVLLAMVAVLPSLAWGQFFDGKTLLMMCTSEPRSFAEGGCVGFIAGISDSLKAAENRRSPNDRVCVPPDVCGCSWAGSPGGVSVGLSAERLSSSLLLCSSLSSGSSG